MTYNNGLPFLLHDSQKSAAVLEQGFCIRLLYFYHCPTISLPGFAEKFKTGKLSLSTVVEVIAAREKVRHVHIGIDEYNKLMQHVYSEGEGESKTRKENAHIVLREMVLLVKKAMGSSYVTLDETAETVLVTSMLTGTARMGDYDYLTGSEGPVDNLYLQPLQLTDVCELMKLLHTNNELGISAERAFCHDVLQAFSIAGLLPRATEMMIELLRTEQSVYRDTAELVAEMTKRIGHRYKLSSIQSWLTNDTIYTVLRNAVLRESVTTLTEIGKIREAGPATYADLEAAGFVLLQEKDSSATQCLVIMPYVWMFEFVNMLGPSFPGIFQLRAALAQLVKTTSSDSTVAWSSFEKFCVLYREAHLCMLKSLTESVHVSDIWSGIATSPQESYKLFPFSKYNLKHQFSNSEDLQLLPEATVQKNVLGASVIDGFVKLGDFFFLEQYRHSSQKEKHAKSINTKELNAAAADFEKTLDQFQETAFVALLLLSNRSLHPSITEKVLIEYTKKNLFVIHRDTLSDHFAYPIAQILIHNSMLHH
jgi:hypothetical protein